VSNPLDAVGTTGSKISLSQGLQTESAPLYTERVGNLERRIAELEAVLIAHEDYCKSVESEREVAYNNFVRLKYKAMPELEQREAAENERLKRKLARLRAFSQYRKRIKHTREAGS
jgi:hypothetical protein